MHMPVFYFCHSTTGCTDSANIRCRNVMRPRILYRAAKNAISCCQECYICQCVYLELKAGSQYAWASVATGSAYKLIWTRVATCTYAGIEISSIPAYATRVQIILYALPVATRRRQVTRRSPKRML